MNEVTIQRMNILQYLLIILILYYSTKTTMSIIATGTNSKDLKK